MSEHADIARDQLALADDRAETKQQQHNGFLTGAVVHALLDLAQAVRESSQRVPS